MRGIKFLAFWHRKFCKRVNRGDVRSKKVSSDGPILHPVAAGPAGVEARIDDRHEDRPHVESHMILVAPHAL